MCLCLILVFVAKVNLLRPKLNLSHSSIQNLLMVFLDKQPELLLWLMKVQHELALPLLWSYFSLTSLQPCWLLCLTLNMSSMPPISGYIILSYARKVTASLLLGLCSNMVFFSARASLTTLVSPFSHTFPSTPPPFFFPCFSFFQVAY